MLTNQSAQIMSMIRSGRITYIGGRPALVRHPAVPNSTIQSSANPGPSPRAKGNRNRTDRLKLALAFLAIYLIWGSTYLAIRYVVETIPPFVAAGLRHSIAGSILFAWAWLRGFRPTRKEWSASLILGALFFFIGHGSLHWAEQYVASGVSALLLATEPMFILLLGWVFHQQRITRNSAIGLGLGVLGVALLGGLEFGVKGSSFAAMLAVLLGSVAWSLGVVLSPRLNLPSNALGRTSLPTLCGAAMLLITAAFTGEFHRTQWSAITMKSLFGLGYLIIFGSVIAFTAYIWLLQRVAPTLVSTHTYANPVVAIILGWLFASEALTARVVLASVVILGAIVLIRRGESVRENSAPAYLTVPKNTAGPIPKGGISEECA
jgi:drug/metabolite transporter (DMT)-like permease